MSDTYFHQLGPLGQLLIEYILLAMPGSLEQLSGTPKWSKIWLSGTPKQSKIWLLETPKWSKIWLLGTAKWNKIAILKKSFSRNKICLKHFSTNPNANWTYGTNIENCDTPLGLRMAKVNSIPTIPNLWGCSKLKPRFINSYSTLIFMSTNYLNFSFPKKGRTHLVILYSENTKTFQPKWLLIFQISSGQMDLNKINTVWDFF